MFDNQWYNYNMKLGKLKQTYGWVKANKLHKAITTATVFAIAVTVAYGVGVAGNSPAASHTQKLDLASADTTGNGYASTIMQGQPAPTNTSDKSPNAPTEVTGSGTISNPQTSDTTATVSASSSPDENVTPVDTPPAPTIVSTTTCNVGNANHYYEYSTRIYSDGSTVVANLGDTFSGTGHATDSAPNQCPSDEAPQSNPATN